MFKQIAVFRVRFGDKDKSCSSNLFAVENDSDLELAIDEYQNLMKKMGTGIINYDCVKIENLPYPVMTPHLFTPAH